MKGQSISGRRYYLWPALLTAAAVFGTVFVILAGRLPISPSFYIPLVETGLRLLSPLSVLVQWAEEKWIFLPKLFIPLIALVSLGVTVRLFKTSGNFLFYVAILSALITAWLIWGAWIVVSGGTIPAGREALMWTAPGRMLLLPVAFLLYWCYRLFGWIAYALPAFLLGAAAILFLEKKRSKREILGENLALVFIEGVLLSLTLSFFGTGGRSLISTWILLYVPSFVAVIVCGILTLITAYVIAGRLTGFTLKKAKLWAKRKKKHGGRQKKFKNKEKEPPIQEKPNRETSTFSEVPIKAEIPLDLSPLEIENLQEQKIEEETGTEHGEIAEDKEDKPEDAGFFEERCEEVFTQFGFNLSYEETIPGPSTILLTYNVPGNLSLSDIRKNEAEIEFRLSEEKGRPIIPMPGKKQIGVLFPRSDRKDLIFSHVLPILHGEDVVPMGLPVYIGRTLEGKDFISDLSEAPHLLVTGSTGSGKSVFLHTLVESLIRGPSSRMTRIVLVDPKRVEFGSFAEGANLACPVVEEPHEVAVLLETLINTMEERFRHLSAAGVKNISELHRSRRTPDMPYIVAVLDEVADIFLSSEGKEIRTSLIKLAQKSRAVGIHLVLATQRPSADIIDGLIKANFPTRVAFRTSSQVDSRVILDRKGAEKLFGKGDGLFISPSEENPVRFQGAYLAL